MTKKDLFRKLSSRKFWVAVAAFVSGLLLAFGKSSEVAETVAGCILQGAAVVGYLLAEGLADAGWEKTEEITAEQIDDEDA